MIFTFANILTMMRLLLLPLIIACFYLESTYASLAIWACFGLYALSSITDFFDGWVARKFDQVSAFGTFLDPIADKIFVASILLLLIAFNRIEGLWLIAVLIIFFREFLISGLREFLGPYNVKMPVSKLAKWKTTVQMISLGILILSPLHTLALTIGQWSLVAAAILTVITGWNYMKIGIDEIKKMP